MWVNADVYWGQKMDVFGVRDWCPGGCNGVGGSDEGHAAYLLAELRNATSGKVIEGYERSKCAFLNVGGARMPLRWTQNQSTQLDPVHTLPNALVQLRFYFRDSIVYAVGVE